MSDRHRETKLRDSLFLLTSRHNKSFNPLVDLVKKKKKKDSDCLEAASQELVLHLQVVSLMHLRLEGLIQNSVARVILNVLPASVAMSEMDSQSREKQT